MRLWRGLLIGQMGLEDIQSSLDSLVSDTLQGRAGIHWTDDPDSAYNFALGRDADGWAFEETWDDEEEGDYTVGVVLEAEVDESDILQPGTEEWDDYAMSDAIFDHDHPESEVTVRADASIDVVQAIVAWVDDDGNSGDTLVPVSRRVQASGGRLYHGSGDDLPIGTVIGANKWGEPVGEAYASTDIDDARAYADFAGRNSDDGRGYVYEVEPLGEFIPDLLAPMDWSDGAGGKGAVRVEGGVEILALVETRDPEPWPWKSSRKTAAWSDVRDKAVRIRNAGQVTIEKHTDMQTVATVQGDHSTYHVTIWRTEEDNDKITTWLCECPWGYWAFRRRYLYTGRVCSHVLAVFYEARSHDLSKEFEYDRTTDSEEYADDPLQLKFELGYGSDPHRRRM